MLIIWLSEGAKLKHKGAETLRNMVKTEIDHFTLGAITGYDRLPGSCRIR